MSSIDASFSDLLCEVLDSYDMSKSKTDLELDKCSHSLCDSFGSWFEADVC